MNLTLRQALQDTLADTASLSSSSSCPSANDWDLHCCCGSVQLQIIIATAVYAVAIFLLWNFRVIVPLKLVVVALHEFGHASAAWLSCGSVHGIEVNADEGGKTTTSGGNRFFILSAGYLGSAFWGMILVIASADFVGVQVAAGLLGAALLVSMVLGRTAVTLGLTLFFLLLLAGFWACTLLTPFNGLRFIILLIGVMSSLFSVYDIYADLLVRRVNESDATQLAKLTGTSSRCWGLIWAAISISFLVLGVYLSLVVAGAPGAM